MILLAGSPTGAIHGHQALHLSPAGTSMVDHILARASLHLRRHLHGRPVHLLQLLYSAPWGYCLQIDWCGGWRTREGARGRLCGTAQILHPLISARRFHARTQVRTAAAGTRACTQFHAGDSSASPPDGAQQHREITGAGEVGCEGGRREWDGRKSRQENEGEGAAANGRRSIDWREECEGGMLYSPRT